MRRSISSKKKKLITTSLAGMLTVAIVGGTIYSDSTTAMARPSLPGIESIVNANSKDKAFKILEIVDDYPSARIGYTVANEEPGDINTADAISDMASEKERIGGTGINGRYMTSLTTTESTEAFNDLKGGAFTYDTYDEDKAYSSDSSAKHGYSYGHFESSTTPGRYEETLSTDVYAQVGQSGNLTIEEVENKDAASDQTGIFYMDYVYFKKSMIGAYELEFSEITTDNNWKKPFLAYTDTESVDYYDKATYVFDKDQEYTYVEDVGADGSQYTDDDMIKLDVTPSVGDIIYEQAYPYGGVTLKFAGYVGTDTNDDPIFICSDGTEIPLESAYNTSTSEYEDSFAKRIKDTETSGPVSKFAVVREEGDADASLTKYYVSYVSNTGYGRFEMKLSPKKQVNDPAFPASDFGIEDESDSTKNWYHAWFYKKNAAEPFTYVESGGNYDFFQDYSYDSVNEYYYKGGYTNNEWFKKEVLDVDAADCGKIYVDVVTKKFEDVTAEDITSANLVYFTGGNYTGDFDEEAACALIKDVIVNDKAVVINLSCYFDTIYNNQASFPVASKFLPVFFFEDIDGIYKNHVDPTDDTKLNSTTQIDAKIKTFTDLYNNHVWDQDLSHVVRTVFIHDDIIDTTTRKDAIYSDFTKAYSDSLINGFTLDNTYKYDGFKDVKVDIDEELFYLGVAGKDVNSFNSTISKATSIRYILNYGNRRAVAKTEIKVLDIEPYYNRSIESAKNTSPLSRIVGFVGGTYIDDITVTNIANIRDIFDSTWYTNNISDSTADLKVTGMGTKEFIGKIEDLNESYDMIYIGMDTAYMNTELKNYDSKNKKAEKTTNVVGNVVNKYVYMHTGDIIKTSGIHGTDGEYAMGGNDITTDKLRELQMFVKAGYAVLLSDEFYLYNDNGTIKSVTDRIDPDSNMFTFAKWVWDEGYLNKNVDITKNFEKTTTATTDGKAPLSHKETFVKYLNISKLDVEVIEEPPLYNTYDGETEHNYIGMNADGLYTLDFKVKLTNDAATDTTKTSYDCQLYIDHDGDGRFEAVEALDSLIITNLDSGNEMGVNEENKFTLTTGSTYSISRRVPEGYVGIIPWKLVFIENNRDTDLIKVSVQDYSAISDLTNKPTIKILQLTSNDSTSTNLDLKNDKTLTGYYKQIKDFNIDVDQDTVRNYVVNDGKGGIFTGGDRLEKLYEYDMLVLGFIDMYRFYEDAAKTEEAVLALREYILSGRSVLFTHDLTSTVITSSHGDKSWGYYANMYLRDVQGMDRYGMVQDNLAGKTYNGNALTEYKSVYDTKVTANGDKWGFSDPTLLRYNADKMYGEIAAKSTRKLGGSERELTSVARVNRGQITEYPFRIGALEQSKLDSQYYAKETIEVAKTHHQYFQLNMETDYTDENYDDDIVVWYAISTDASDKYYHRLNYNDVRNNYYIFNKGNITYTGAGHSKIEDNSNSGNAEKKLFVNTLVAAYNAGTHAPYASYKSNGTNGATDISSLYIPYDIEMAKPVEDGGEGDGWLDDTVTVYFKTVNNNLQDNKLPLIAEYYVEVESNGAYKIGGKEYDLITPTSIFDCTNNTAVTDANVLTNGHVYKLEFNIKGNNGLLKGSDVNTRYSAKLYTRMRAQTKNKDRDWDIADMNKSATISALPASDSFEQLAINFTQLYDLE